MLNEYVSYLKEVTVDVNAWPWLTYKLDSASEPVNPDFGGDNCPLEWEGDQAAWASFLNVIPDIWASVTNLSP
jgi:hypothetical protein